MDFSIASALSAGGDKNYIRRMEPDGFEMGVGRSGLYDAHAHRGFTDIAYAPGGLIIHQRGAALNGKLHVTTPGAWFGPIEFLSDFWFIKFFQSESDTCDVPDKITSRGEANFEGCLVADGLDAKLTLYHPGRDCRELTLRLQDETFEIFGLESCESRLRISA